MSQSLNPNNSIPKKDRINEFRLSEVCQLLEHSFGDCSTSYLLQILNELDSCSDVQNKPINSNLQEELLKSIIKAGLDSTCQSIEIIEDKGGSGIYFIGKDNSTIASVNTKAPALLILRQALHYHAWEVDSEGYSSTPIYYYEFSDGIKGAMSFSTPTTFQNGSTSTTISILRAPSIHYISHYIIED